MRRTPSLALALLLLALGIDRSAAAEIKCVASQGYVAVAREHTGEVGSDVVVRKARDTKAKGACAIKPTKGDYVVLPKTNESYFLALQSGLLALDAGTGGQRSLTVIDVATRKPIVADVPYADGAPLGFHATSDGMTFWRIGRSIDPAQCPADWRTRDDNKSATKAHEADEIAITSGAGAAAKPTGRKDCVLTEDDL